MVIRHILDAVKIMLPLENSFPLEGLAVNIAAEPCLTARKHLKVDSTKGSLGFWMYERKGIDPHCIHKGFNTGVCQRVAGRDTGLRNRR